MNLTTGKKAWVAALAAVLASCLMAGSAVAAWTPPSTVATESNSASFGAVLAPVPLSNGQSLSYWLEYDEDETTSVVGRRIGRDGNPVDAQPVVFGKVTGTPTTDAWIAEATATETSPGDLLVAWVERSFVYAPQSPMAWAIKARSLYSSGAMGPVTTIATGGVPSDLGSDTINSLSLASGGGKTAIAWVARESRGSDCSSYYSSEDCVVKAISRGAIVNSDGVPAGGVATLMDTVTECSFSAMESHLEVAPDGTATEIMTFCRDQADEPGINISFRKFGSSGPTGPQTLLTWVDSPPTVSSGIDDSGVVSVSVNSRVYRINADGSATEPVIVGDSGQNDYPIEQIAVQPGGTTTATWTSTKAGGIGGNGLDYSVWTRQLKSDGSLADRNFLLSTTVDKPAGGWIYFAFRPRIATGEGVDTGTVAVTSYRDTNFGPPSYSGQQNNDIWVAELKADGSFASSQTLAGGTEVYQGDIGVSADGTAAVSWVNVAGTGFASVMSSKLARDTSSCGVTPANCKAKLAVASIKPGKGKIKAGGKLTVKVTIKNVGTKDATGAKATVKSGNKRVKAPKSVSFGNIAVGASVTKKFTLKAKGKAKGKVKVTVKAGDSSRSVKYAVKAKKSKKAKKKKR